MIRGLSHYRLLRRLGSGGQAEVYLAFDTRLKRRVCIKLYHLAGSLASRRRAVLEARHLMQVQSPQTVDIYDVVSAGSRLALVVQYVPGCTLQELLARIDTLSPPNALALLTDLAAALAAVRRAGLVHGDVKPANVLIDVSGRAVLADFGTAQLVGDQWSAYSRESLSPEQSRGGAAVLESDFFALGLLLYRMLFGVHPFFDHGDLDTRRLRIGLGELPPLPELSIEGRQSIDALLRRLLAPQPHARPQGTFELREILRDVRSLLAAPSVSDLPLRAAVDTSGDNFIAARLPRKLVRIPLGQQCKAWLLDYWTRGSAGARALLVFGALLPGLLLALLWARPGPCIAVAMPQINIGPDARLIATDEQQLRILLTSLLKSLAKEAVVLGVGASSDSRYTVGAAGSHNVCIAQSELQLQLDCDLGRCLLRLRGVRDTQTQELQLSLPQASPADDLKVALAQLVGEQTVFLMR
ncbi:MAG: serine/threonine protein kinase [Congregibacter sp.]|nr:serine/threonine protein kinase [Congregibacter sp.]